jgi:hydroxyethylthiazole kinase
MNTPDVDLTDLATIEEASPLVNAITNEVTVNDVAQVILHWGGLPVMSDDEREAADMVAGAQSLLLNMGTVSEDGEATMMAAGTAANDAGVPVVLDPVGVGATPTRDRVAERLASELDVAILNGNHGEIAALTGEDAEVRGVESVGEYADIAETAIACAREYETVVVASGETDVVATSEVAFEINAGHEMMGTVVGTGCMQGGTLATMAGAIDKVEEAALLGTAAFGLAGEAAAAGDFGEYHGPASYSIAFRDAIAGLREASPGPLRKRIERLVEA